MNAPDRYERFVVPEGIKKVSYERDTKIVNAAAFTIEREDHTIGNILRMQLHSDPNVLFAGYKLPHPLQYKIIVRIQTTSQSSPTQAYSQAIEDLDKELDHLKKCFELKVAMGRAHAGSASNARILEGAVHPFTLGPAHMNAQRRLHNSTPSECREGAAGRWRQQAQACVSVGVGLHVVLACPRDGPIPWVLARHVWLDCAALGQI
ncbi:hypothetical protein Cni_G11231 [Canna indica]|uniref:DNA-directed RNA polymerase RBP11-like dimerisation domain-containing protein n=1 Tax=Canna indica TaxID=4628 RepID=A0AAQ3K5P9_9LILI|nr:hypothetical protein Cni_G11231 [Canna indica]